MYEVPAAVEIYRRVIDCQESDISGSIHSGFDLFQRDVTPRSPTHLPHVSCTTLQPQVKLEFGHHATLRLKPTFEGYTHDWEVFVRSPEGADCQIQHFVKRVEFHLHQSFSRQKIVQKEPPFKLNESGYAGFVFPIDVYFRNPGQPKKIRFLYDLTLDPLRSTIHIRCEKLTFRNPPELFRRLLIKGGGLVRRRRQNPLNDTGLVRSTLGRCLDVKPSLQSSGIEPDLSPNEQIIDSKEWFKIKQELPETPQQLNQDKENQPQGSATTQSKSSISFLQDWLRNISSTKLSKRGSREIPFEPSIAVTSSELKRGSFSSGIFSADSWISEGKEPGGGVGGLDSWLSDGKRATGRISGSAYCTSDRKLGGSGIGEAGRDGMGGKGRGGERRALREMKQLNGNWDSPVSSVTQPFTIKLKMADKRNERSQMRPSLSRKLSSRRGRNPTKFASPAASIPFSYTHPQTVHPQTAHPQTVHPQTVLREQTLSTSKTFKTKTDILNSITRRRLLKVNGQLQTPLQTQRPQGSSTSSVSGIRFQINQSLMPQTLKDSTIGSGVVPSPVLIQRRGRGRPRKNPLLPRPEKPDPAKRKRSRPAVSGSAIRTRNSSKTLGNSQGNNMGDSKRHLPTVAPSSSDDDDIVFLGYSPPKQEPQNDADYGVPRQASVVDLGTTRGRASSRPVGRPIKVCRKRSTQLELLKSATEEFVGSADGSGMQTEQVVQRVRDECSVAVVKNASGKGKRKIGRGSSRGSNLAARLPSSQEREDDWIVQNYRRKKLKIVPVRCGSDNEDDEDTGVSDLSAEYPSDVYRSSALLRASNFVNAIEKPGHGSRGTAHTEKSALTWMTSTPMKPKTPAVRRKNVRPPRPATKRRNKEEAAWSRSGQNVKQSKRGRPRKVPQTPAMTQQQSDDFESSEPLVPSSNPTASPEIVTASGESVAVLMELQQRLATLADGHLLKRVVQIVEDSGLYQLDDAMFDFDLCNLDRPTIEKLKVCLR